MVITINVAKHEDCIQHASDGGIASDVHGFRHCSILRFYKRVSSDMVEMFTEHVVGAFN